MKFATIELVMLIQKVYIEMFLNACTWNFHQFTQEINHIHRKHASINQNQINISTQFPITVVFKYEND